MENGSEIREGFWQQFHRSTSLDEVIDGLTRLDMLARNGDLALADAYTLRETGFRALMRLTADDPVIANDLIETWLLPRCIERVTDIASEVRISVSRYRGVLGDWLNLYSSVGIMAPRERALDWLANRLAHDPSAEICWTIAAIGFRRSDIAAVLWRLSTEHSDALGNVALAVRVSLGITAAERQVVATVVRERAAKGFDLALRGVFGTLADPKSVDTVVEHWLRTDDEETWLREGSLALRMLTHMADALYDQVGFQDRIWGIVLDKFYTLPEAVFADVYLGSDVAPYCNSPKVIRSMLNLLNYGFGSSQSTSYQRWLLHLRLESCYRPQQLKGWATPVAPVVREIVRQDASSDTKSEVRSATEATNLKDAAWDTALRLGNPELLNWFHSAVVGETSRFVRMRLCEALACFRLDPLPRAVAEWITSRYDEESPNSSTEWASRMGAIRIAHSTATSEAFDALAKPGFTFKGNLLQQSVDALADVAIELARAGDGSVIERLVNTAVSPGEPLHRRASLGALHIVADRGFVPTGGARRLTDLLDDDELDQFERSLVVGILGRVPEAQLTSETVARIRVWASDRDDWLGGRSLETLARRDLLSRDEGLLVNRLGLMLTDDGWDLPPAGQCPEWSTSIIGLLYAYHSRQFEPAVVSTLRNQNWNAAVQMIHRLREATNAGVPLPKAVERALVDRVGKRQSSTFAELDLFSALSDLAPNALALEPWQNVWSDWLPDARAALADALGTAALTRSGARANALNLLLLLTRDGQYAVRRASYRALARRSPELLLRTCEGLASSVTVELRQRAAEACAWLADRQHEAAFKEISEQLAYDPEPTVRNAVDHARSERRERGWARLYLARVRRAYGAGNHDALVAWRYGDALTRVGDDTSIAALRQDVVSRDLPPHTAHWVRHLMKGLSNRWREVTQKWPEPWVAVEGGAIEQGEGKISLPGGRWAPIHYTLWHRASPTPSTPSDWGGVVWPLGLTESVAIMDHTFTSELELQDGRHARVAWGGIAGGIGRFKGNGHYPS